MKVGIIGLGTMGSALAKTLKKGGYEVNGWNRTFSKAEHLSRENIKVEEDLISVIDRSELLILNVADYKSSYSIFSQDGIREALSGKTLIQLSTGTPQDAKEMDKWAADAGIKYLDGAIMVTPVQIGTEESIILVSGDEKEYNRYSKVLSTLAVTTSYLGENIGAASANDLALLSVFFSSLIGFSHAALICKAEGLDLNSFSTQVRDWMPAMGSVLKTGGDFIAKNNYSDVQGSLQTCYISLELVSRHAKESGINNVFPKFSTALFKKGMDAGFGNEDGAAIYKVLDQKELILN